MALVFIGANNPETIRVINAVKKQTPLDILGFIDNDPAKKGIKFFGYNVIGGFDILSDLIKDHFFVNLITRDCITRFETSKYVAERGGRFINFIHPNVNLEMVGIGVGNYFQESVIIQAGVSIGNNSSIHMGSLIGHESKIGNSVFIAHGCNISGLVEIEDGVFIGTGATILPRIKIGKWSIIGAGTVITKNVPEYSVVAGVPGREIRQLEHKHTSGDIF
jgi:sugar O-acyltransferase (sialic acid O-acetyltransferase NeuD family)